jgi:hypothetical protein
MTFFNKKEEVLNIELTQFGKHMLSKGMFIPEYYAFFDTNILYDGQYGGIVEEPREVQSRISTTPQRKTQYCFVSLEKQVKELTEKLRNLETDMTDPDIQNYYDKEYALNYPIGTSSTRSVKYPAWSINFLKGEIESNNSHIDSAQAVIKIPTLTMENVDYETRIKVIDTEPEPPPPDVRVYEDGSYIEQKEDFLLLSIDEENTEQLNHNFEIEVFMVELIDEQGNAVTKEEALTLPTKQKLYPLSFIKQQKQVENNILVRTDITPDDVDFSDLTSGCVEYWLDVLVDDEIDESIICENIPDQNPDNSIFTYEQYNCPDKVIKSAKPSNVIGIDEGDDC